MANRIFPIGAPNTNKYESHFMTYEDAMKCVKALKDHPLDARGFRAMVESAQLFYHIDFHAQAIKKLLNQKGAKSVFGRTGKVEGLRHYPGFHQGRVNLVIVGIDADGNDIQTMAVNFGQPCPPLCVIDPDD